MNTSQERRLKKILALPTAPFRENAVTAYATEFCGRSRIPCFNDPAGNVIVGAKDRAAYRTIARGTAREPLRLFIAHTDHPGFHGLERLGRNRFKAIWHGGSPVKHLRGARVWIADQAGYQGHGEITSAKIHKAGYAITELTIRAADPGILERPAKSLFGGFGFRAPVWQSGERIYTKAADDLVGVFAILETALALKKARSRRPFLGLLTRGEEVGFVGAVAHFELGWLPPGKKQPMCVSVETSRTLPGAIIGKGPVVRLGDRRTVFDPAGLSVLTELAARLLPGKHQRRIMDGGVCEAAAATAWGLPAIGISVPLGNYHNQGFEGGADCRGPQGPAPEFVHADDVSGLLRLCRGLMEPRLGWDDAWRTTRARLAKNSRRYRREFA